MGADVCIAKLTHSVLEGLVHPDYNVGSRSTGAVVVCDEKDVSMTVLNLSVFWVAGLV